MSAGIGVVVPYDFALDRELWRWVPEGADLHLTRTPFVALPVGTDQAWAISDASVVACGVHDLVAVEPHVVAYGCTSGSFVGGLAGEKWLCETMVAAGAPVAVTTSGALVSALDTLHVRRVAIATPYDEETTRLLVTYLAECGITVTSSRNLGLTGRVWTVPYEVTADLVRSAVGPGAEAVFVSCTNLPTFDLVAPLEAELGLPVLTANQVTMWAALRAAGLRAVDHGQRLPSLELHPMSDC